MCAGLLTHMGNIVYDELDNSIIVEQKKAPWVENFLFDTDHSASSLQLYRTLSTKAII